MQLNFAWLAVTSPAAVLIFGILNVALLSALGKHTRPNGDLDRGRLGTVFALSASLYICIVLVLAQITFKGHAISELIKVRVGDERMAYLLTGLSFDVFLRLWERFRA